MPEILPVLIVSKIQTNVLSSRLPIRHVIQVGAGPAGLVAALALAQNGIKLRLVDKAERPHVGNRGFGVQVASFHLSTEFKTSTDEIIA